MGEVERARLKVELSRHYYAQRSKADPSAIDALALAMVAEDARRDSTQGRHLSLPAFVAAQARFIPAWTWAAQAALVALMGVVAVASDGSMAAALAVGMLSAMTVLVAVPTVCASKLHGVTELEYSCANNAASVLTARLAVLGCSSALAVALMVAVASSVLDASAFSMALWA